MDGKGEGGAEGGQPTGDKDRTPPFDSRRSAPYARSARIAGETPPVQWVREHGDGGLWHRSADPDGLVVLCGTPTPGSPLVRREGEGDPERQCPTCARRSVVREMAAEWDRIAALATTSPAPPPEPEPTPFGRLLPGEWRWLRDALRATLVLVHDSGLWVEVADDTTLRDLDEDRARVLVGALTRGVEAGLVGRYTVAAVSEDGRLTSAGLVSAGGGRTAEAERADVVAWLRSRIWTGRIDRTALDGGAFVDGENSAREGDADDIEDGEHVGAGRKP